MLHILQTGLLLSIGSMWLSIVLVIILSGSKHVLLLDFVLGLYLTSCAMLTTCAIWLVTGPTH